MAENKTSWREEGVLEGALIRTIFILLLGASVTILGLDLRGLIQKVAEDGSEQTMRIVFEPPTRTDQQRPYFPRALPVLPGSESPMMPGISGRPTPELVAERMSFYVGQNGDASAIGRIESGTAADFEKFLDRNGANLKTIWFLSPGGSVLDAINIGRSIRKRKLNTSVADKGYCASSCPLAFAGGVARHAGSQAMIGVHQIYAVPEGNETWHDGISAAQQISAQCEEYLVGMGVDPGAWIKAMQTPKERLYIFRPEELRLLKWTVQEPSVPKPVTLPPARPL
jgi:hypothetical protein